MLILYKYKGKVYTYNQLYQFFFRQRKFTDFKEWFDKNLSDKIIINYTENKSQLNLEEVTEYAYLHVLHTKDLGDISFQDDIGEKIKIVDAELGVYISEKENKTMSYEDLEEIYGNRQIFSICS